MFEPQNRLERSLMQAADDPAHRPQFYRDLLASDLLMIDHDQTAEETGSRTLEAGETLQVQQIELDGQPYVPVFSSLPRLQQVLTEEAGYLAINARELLHILEGAEVVLNPGSPYGKIFTREEIDSLLDGTLFEPSERYVAEQPTEVMIGQPATPPHQLIEALTRLFSRNENVQAAYLAHFFNPSRDEQPHTLIGIEVSGGWDEVVAEAGLVAREVEVPDPPVDFLQITGGGGVEEYLRTECEPFFERKGS